MGGLGWPELTVIAIIVVALFGWKRLPDMARSLGRSARIFKSEVDEMKKDGKAPAGAAHTTVRGDVLDPDGTGRDAALREADARAAEADRRAAEARAEAARLRGDTTV